jgi:DmsE family decaheme c-type cytochrome
MLSWSPGGIGRLLAILSSALFLSLGGVDPVAAQPSAKPAADDVCAGCHSDYADRFAASTHGVKADVRTPASNGGCLVCHSDNALDHAKKDGARVPGLLSFKDPRISADAKNDICLTCHRGGSTRTHWDTSIHAERGNACTSCHTMHEPDKVLTKLTQPEVCFKCHKQQRVEVNRMFRHPILEGKVACSDCHNPHGSIGRALMKRDSVVETCYQCHAEKRGPFVHPHDPVTEDCSLCHNPHGTVADSMLKIRPPFLCHQCHTPHGGNIAQLRGQPGVGLGATAVPPPLGGVSVNIQGRSGNNYTQGRGCANCHTQVHGTNNSSTTPPTPQFMLR